MDAAVHYSSEFERLKTRLPGQWFLQRREAAMTDFRETGFPDTRLEDWRYTDVRAVAGCGYTPACAAGEASEPQQGLGERFTLSRLLRHELVFVNGRYCPHLSCIGSLHAGTGIHNLARSLDDPPPPLAERLTTPPRSGHGFALLNTAFLDDGVFVHVPSNVCLDEPIHLLYLIRTAEAPLAVHPRNVVVLDDGASAVFVESYLSLDDNVHLCNALTQVTLAAGASLEHYRVMQTNPQGCHVGNLHLSQERDSRFRSCSVTDTRGLARYEAHIDVAGERARTDLYGLYAASGQGHADCLTRIEHCVPNTGSAQLFRGLMRDRGRGVFNGRVTIRPNAQKTEARQNNANLLLSDHARADTRPMLEIYADDVSCSHGATVGRLDEQALHYVRTRGLTEREATDVLAGAFANEVLSQIGLAPLRRRLELDLFDRPLN